MANTLFVKTRVQLPIKQQIRSLAQQAGTNESIWVRQAILVALRNADAVPLVNKADGVQVVATRPGGRISLRLAAADQQLLVDRAAARGMQPATYAAVLTRAHLRNLTPLPIAELGAFRTALLELNTIGRNLNRIAQAINRADQAEPPGKYEALLMLKVCSTLRDHLHQILKANLKSWKVGHAEK